MILSVRNALNNHDIQIKDLLDLFDIFILCQYTYHIFKIPSFP